jgi:glutamate-1-semialdehyde 2,1-aminomutase
MQRYQYPKSRELFERAVKVIPAGIPGHLGPASGCFIPVSAYPFFCERAEGTYFWDVDGNRFIDYMCAYGPNILGYNHPEVDAAARAQIEKANCTTVPAPLMIELAELLVDTVDSADWAMFAKNGGDVTNLAMLTARAATGRKKIVKFVGGYHGVHPWMLDVGYPGVLYEDIENIITIPFNNVKMFKRVLADHHGDIAGVISTPYDHQAMNENHLPADGFWNEVRQLCTANGYNISALCGAESLRPAISSIFATGSYWLSAVPIAAAIRCIEILREINAPQIMKEIGDKFADGLIKVADEHCFELRVTGERAMPILTLGNDDSNFLLQEWVAEMMMRGIFLANHHNIFMNCAVSDEDLEQTFAAAHDAFETVRKNHPEMYR